MQRTVARQVALVECVGKLRGMGTRDFHKPGGVKELLASRVISRASLSRVEILLGRE